MAGVAAFLLGCSSGPQPRLFLLDAGVALQSREAGPARTPEADPPGKGHLAAEVRVLVPQYLQRPELMIRTSPYETRPVENAQWAEDLPITASRAVADALNALLPGDDIAGWPSKLDRPIGVQINIDLSQYEADRDGTVTIVGRWAVTDSTSGDLEASGTFRHAANASATEPGAIVAAMSEALASVAADIAPAMQKLESVRRR